jgi:hypothetical protein
MENPEASFRVLNQMTDNKGGEHVSNKYFDW